MSTSPNTFDLSIIKKYAIPVSPISLPVLLHFFDGSTNAVISQEVDLSLHFSHPPQGTY
ncbi:hypothetical protein M404DRAFT_31814 [Pisolithus tinctorius Marx 270]|uniref:Uncharacterized protein n=1 Tax=Pisolithus tinctorius Marx 270 TaxID=870435 RepID=A0A0C3NRR1_PISTI|nr:hypothetical protein M404DRAFT_31814 [Pisolithus tinctorius Marx 270]